MQDNDVQISIGAEIVTKARIGAFGSVKCRLVGDEAVLTFAGGALELALAEPALEELVDSAQEVLDAMVERH
jgi:CYTH domain-containing protein